LLKRSESNDGEEDLDDENGFSSPMFRWRCYRFALHPPVSVNRILFCSSLSLPLKMSALFLGKEISIIMNSTVTRAWVHAHKSAKGGWTREQLKLLGVNWPPPVGWIDQVEGKTITDKAKAKFEEIGRGGKKKVRRLNVDGLPIDAKDWTEADWRDLHEAIERVKRNVAARHRQFHS
jgi:hypothetical protein